MQQLISRAEIRKAIKSTKRGSAPGPDGIPIEFYKIFKRTWGIILAQIYSEIVRKRKMPETMTESFLTLLPKKNKDQSSNSKLETNFTVELGLQDPNKGLDQ